MDTAGTRKSYLINTIRGKLDEIAKEHNLHENNTVFAPTGVVAFNIEGRTIHSALSVLILNVELEGESLKKFQNKLKYIQYFIIDEMSMVGRRFLAIIDLRLRQAFSDHSNIPFGGRFIILVRDFGQLPPVCDVLMYS